MVTIKLDPARPQKKIAIVGCAGSKDIAPYDDPSWQIWGVNNLFNAPPPQGGRFNAWFEIHTIEEQNGRYYRRWKKDFRGQDVNEYLMKIAELNIPVIMQKHWDIIPQSVPYPLEKALEFFPVRYFTNTISYEIALAIMEGATEIGIWGVDMAVDTEYHHQRPSCEYFIGVAEGLGIPVTIPKEADLLKTRFLYGFEEKEQAAFKAKLSNMQTNILKKKAEAEHKMTHASRQVEQYIGAETAIREIVKIWD